MLGQMRSAHFYLFAALLCIPRFTSAATNEFSAVAKTELQIRAPRRLYTDDEAVLFSHKLKSVKYPSALGKVSKDIGIDLVRLRGAPSAIAFSFISPGDSQRAEFSVGLQLNSAAKPLPSPPRLPLFIEQSLQLSPRYNITFLRTAAFLPVEAQLPTFGDDWEKDYQVYWVEIAPKRDVNAPINSVEPTRALPGARGSP
ncbi:MAG: hypothetical protein PCFJNLEI_03541 [Verrucomicrobiae bacterium]|nr:hypothetical protein [Verrucomicrobiae bacterium]